MDTGAGIGRMTLARLHAFHSHFKAGWKPEATGARSPHVTEVRDQLFIVRCSKGLIVSVQKKS
ncbi:MULTISPECIES: hypothetical protein [Nitratireductor]|uniref:hypothetical protein n=1 Tax=Nitratireductor TaxID=245876 RepID=UPI000D0CC6A9|nr:MULTISPECIES: hypothetical protein [Nitratireductor]PSM19983.1 hypothetical protein C7T96_02690 [Nitratireductor sp. StC3]